MLPSLNGLLGILALLGIFARSDAYEPVPSMATFGKEAFDQIAHANGNSKVGMSATQQSNPLQFPTITDFWAAWELADRPRIPALLVDDMQVEYEPYVRGILPQVKLLVAAFREAGLPVFWSTWWRWGPDDGHFNAMDRFYGPIGWRTGANALYNHDLKHGGDVLSEIAPITDTEKRRVMHKSYSLDMFDERPMEWLVPDGQRTLHEELQKLGVDTVVQVGAWTDDCIISSVFHAFSLQYDVVVVEDGVSTASKQHFTALEVMRGAAAKILFAENVAEYIYSWKEHQKSIKPSDVANNLIAAPEVYLPLNEHGTHASKNETFSDFGMPFLMISVAFTCFAAGWVCRGRVKPQAMDVVRLLDH